MMMYAAEAWSPKKTPRAQAVGEVPIRMRVPPSPASAPVDAVAPPSCGVSARRLARSFSTSAHGRIASTPSSAQAPSPARQPPPRAPAMGTVTAAAPAVPSARPIEYRPVIEPTREGNQRLTTTGISTLLTAMPARASALAATKAAVPPASGRSARPTVIVTMPANTTGAGPRRRARRGARLPKTAKHRAGTEVSRPATAPLMPRSARTSFSSGPSAEIAGRRLRAARTRPAATRRTAQRETAGEPASRDSGFSGRPPSREERAPCAAAFASGSVCWCLRRSSVIAMRPS